MKPVRELDAGNPHVQFDERDVETALRRGYLGTARRKGWQQTNRTYCYRATSRLYILVRRDLEKRRERLEACARNLALPTLLVRGGLSDVLSEAGAQDFLKLCPHSEYVNVTGAAHMVAGDRNDIFGNAVIEFLSRAVPVRGEPVQPAHEPHAHHEGPAGDINDVL